jgi:AraC-like DNA-binding protein
MSRSPKNARDPTDSDAFDAIHGDMLRNFRELVADLGGDPAGMLARVGVGSGISAAGPAATYRQFVLLMEAAAADLDCADFGMQLAVRQSANAFTGPLGDGMRNSPTFGEALQFVSSHSYAHSLAAWIWLQPSLSGRSVIVGHDILLEGLPQKSQAMEYILLVGNLATLNLTEGHVRARQVLFRHQPISPPKSYRRYFGCPVGFGRNSDAVIYGKHDISFQISTPDPQARQLAAATIENRFTRRKPPLHANVRGVISHILGTEPCTRERVARAVNIHPRTMQRRLLADGTSFQQVKDEVRRDRLLYYLAKTDLPFGSVSEKLGFTEQAVMSRRCREWFASSPTALRMAMRLAAHPKFRRD